MRTVAGGKTYTLYCVGYGAECKGAYKNKYGKKGKFQDIYSPWNPVESRKSGYGNHFYRNCSSLIDWSFICK